MLMYSEQKTETIVFLTNEITLWLNQSCSKYHKFGIHDFVAQRTVNTLNMKSEGNFQLAWLWEHFCDHGHVGLMGFDSPWNWCLFNLSALQYNSLKLTIKSRELLLSDLK